MIKVLKGRGEGKTTELIKISAEKQIPILSPCYPSYIKGMAYKMGLRIPEPIFLDDLIKSNREDIRFHIGDIVVNEILVDEADWVLSKLLEKLNLKLCGLSMTNPTIITKEMIADKFNVHIDELQIEF